jgi:hypothetical protein
VGGGPLGLVGVDHDTILSLFLGRRFLLVLPYAGGHGFNC